MNSRRAAIVLVVLATACAHARAPADGIVATFRLLGEVFVVGEPILVVFDVTNGGERPFTFFTGGNYRGALRDENFTLRVTDATGRVFSLDPQGTWGGAGQDITLAPGERFRNEVRLNPWVHVLPPGDYAVRCERTLSERPLDEDPGAPALRCEQDLRFRVVPYDRAAIVRRLESIERADRDDPGIRRFFQVPVDAAYADVARVFGLDVPEGYGRAEARAFIRHALPDAWDDRRYLRYELRENRNWLTRDEPEEYRLTLAVQNHGPVPRPHRLGESTLAMNGETSPAWPDLVQAALSGRGIPANVPPGESLEIDLALGADLPRTDRVALEWRVDGREFRTRLEWR